MTTNLEVLCSSGTSVTIYQSSRRNITEDFNQLRTQPQLPSSHCVTILTELQSFCLTNSHGCHIGI